MILNSRVLKYLILSLAFSTQVCAQCWSEISAGSFHSLAIKKDGTLWAWGASGLVGDGTGYNRNIPIRLGATSDTNWSKISAGGSHSLAIKKDGTLWAWGGNNKGQLGIGTNDPTNTPITLSPIKIGTDTNWSKISAGIGEHSLALKTDGTLWSWGVNNYGQLGEGTTKDRNTPTQIGTDTNWIQVSAGGLHSHAIKTDGTLWSWGGNTNGQLGKVVLNGKINNPIKIGENWQVISAGEWYSLGIKTDGSKWAWGKQNRNVLGTGTTADVPLPKLIGSIGGIAVSAGSTHSLFINSPGTLNACGYNYNGQLGNGGTTDLIYPTQIGSDKDWSAIDNGQQHSIALKKDGTLWTWGGNTNGQLGNGKLGNTPNSYPFQITCPSANLLENKLDELVSIYPNPTQKQLTIRASLNLLGTFYYIYNSYGQLIESGEIYDELTEFDFVDFSSGCYTIRIGGSVFQTFNVVKE